MPFLRPLPMARIGIVGLKNDRDAILGVLHDLNVVQVEPVGKEALEVVAVERGSPRARPVADQLLRMRGLKAALPRGPTGAPRLYRDLDEILAAAATVTLDAEVAELKRGEDAALTERKTTDEELAVLRKFGFYTDRLEYLRSDSVFAFFGETDAKTYQELARAIPGLTDADFLSQLDGKVVRFLVAVRRSQADAVSRLAQQKGVHLFNVPRQAGTPAEAVPALERSRAEIDQRLNGIHARLAQLSAHWYPLVAALEEALAIENRKYEAWARLGAGERSFALEGWIARRDLPRLEAAVQATSQSRAEIYEIPTKEEPPTVMVNPSGVRYFEFFIRFYSLPLSSEWDPTWIFALAFPLFFGLMLGDMGYGLVILGFCIWMIYGFPGRQRIPSAIKEFPKLIMPPSAMQSLAYTLVPAASLAIGFGAVFNEFFGFHILPFNSPYDPIASLGKLLLLSGYIGLTMVVLGFGLGALKEYFHHHYRGALGKLGGIFFALGLASIGLALLTGRAYFPPGVNLLILLSYVSLLGGLLLMIVGEGAMGLMGVIETVSHILSYTRIVGILLASVILAFVIDKISFQLFGAGPIDTVFGAVILIGGQIFNLVLAVFEPGIQGARLIFVEHLSKYYGGNGRIFRPFGSTRRLTIAPNDPAAAAARAP
ncbi:MAG: hypothetical protein L3K17_00240 [Thermoplasmata archaeon]|nr:hypothetical protein [Thermoplasmata archaeon]